MFTLCCCSLLTSPSHNSAHSSIHNNIIVQLTIPGTDELYIDNPLLLVKCNPSIVGVADLCNCNLSKQGDVISAVGMTTVLLVTSSANGLIFGM